MVEVEITPEMLSQAQEKADSLGELKNSVSRGKGNLTGFLGEICAQKVLGGEFQNTHDYDLVMPDGTKYDVKSRSGFNPPHDQVECSVINKHQKCDKYVFVWVLRDHSKAFVVGELSKQEYFEKAIFIQQGQFDPRTRWRCKADCYNVRADQFHEIQR